MVQCFPSIFGICISFLCETSSVVRSCFLILYDHNTIRIMIRITIRIITIRIRIRITIRIITIRIRIGITVRIITIRIRIRIRITIRVTLRSWVLHYSFVCVVVELSDITPFKTCGGFPGSSYFNWHRCFSPFSWEIGTWSTCSDLCGPSGKRTRTVECRQKITNTNDQILDDSKCKQSKQKTEEECNRKDCEPNWEAGEWSAVSKNISVSTSSYGI